MHIDISQNVLQALNLLNRKLEKKKKKDRWRLIWFSGSLHKADAIAAKRALERGNSYDALKATMKKFEEKERDQDAESASLSAKAKPLD
ncbi:MAG: hypothetical protein AAGJ79_12480 [Verrucomicrobiota bacterium]